MVQVKIDTRRLEKHFKHHVPKDVRAAVVEALGDTAETASKMLVHGLREVFTLRSKWIQNSFRHDNARLGDWPRPFAVVGTISPLLEPHVEGGDRPQKGEEVGVPLVGRGRARAQLKSMTRPARWPGAMVESANSFIADDNNRNPRLRGRGRAVFKRMGGKKRNGLKLIWLLRDEVKIKPRWRFVHQVEVVVEHFFEQHLEAAMNRRIAASKAES